MVKTPPKNRLEGVIKTITFHNPDNGFSVLKIKPHEATQTSLFDVNADLITATGIMLDPQKGASVILEGTYESHPKFGRQLSFTHYQKETTLTEDGLVDYLASDLFPGIGPKSAAKIIETLGLHALDLIRENPAILDSIPGVSKTAKEHLPEALKTHFSQEKIRVKLLSYGISVGLIKILIKAYGDQTVDKVLKKPYDLMKEIKGIGFERADAIAQSVGFEINHPDRLRALVAHLFETLSMRQGHTHLPREVLYQHLKDRFIQDGLSSEDDVIIKVCEEAVLFGWLIEDDESFTLPLYQRAERTIAQFIQTAHDQEPVVIKTFETKLKTHLDTLEMTYTDEQVEAIKAVFNHPITLITGGPGTGKTTLIKSVIDLAKTFEFEVAAIAPTGKAARRLTEATGHKAYTIHRFLGIRPDGKPQFHKYVKAPAQFFIVDEISMVDVVLMATLIEAMPEDATLVLVGDDAQLPSVSPGHVMADIKDIVKTVKLNEIHRQAKASPIITLAESFRRQTYQAPWQSAPYLTMENTPEKESLKTILTHFKTALKNGIEDVAVLIPMYQGESGIDAVNAYLQMHLNPHPLIKLTEQAAYKIDDKVIQLTNNYDTLIMNGDMGKITAIDPILKTVTVAFEEAQVTYDKETFLELRLAYAISIHKSQGSGFEMVIMPLYRRFMHMLTRPLIYTGITRAKTHLHVLGDLDLIPYALSRNTHQRLTKLRAKLTQDTPPTEEDISPYDFL